MTFWIRLECYTNPVLPPEQLGPRNDDVLDEDASSTQPDAQNDDTIDEV